MTTWEVSAVIVFAEDLTAEQREILLNQNVDISKALYLVIAPPESVNFVSRQLYSGEEAEEWYQENYELMLVSGYPYRRNCWYLAEIEGEKKAIGVVDC